MPIYKSYSRCALLQGRIDRVGASQTMESVKSMASGDKLGMAVGSRAHLEAKAIAQRSWHRNLLMHGFHFVVLLVAGGAVKDTQCGFKVSAATCTRRSDMSASAGWGTGHKYIGSASQAVPLMQYLCLM